MRREKSGLQKLFGQTFRLLFRLCRWGVVVLILGCGALTISGMNEDIFKADVIVIPGNAVSPEGVPSPRLAARLDRGLELYTEGLADKIIVSGGTGWQGVDEAGAMKKYLVARGVPSERVVVDPNGVTTWATASFTAAWMRENNASSALVVTQYFHVPRTVMALERFGVPKVGKAYARFWEWRDIFSVPRDLVGWVYYRQRSVEVILPAAE